MSALSICLLAKAPNSGHSKTRLEPALGQEGAAALARALLLDALACWAHAPVDLLVATTGQFDTELVHALASIPQIEQVGEDLGARMEHALRAGLRQSEIAVVVGSDMPALDHQHLLAVIDAMRSHDAVLVPAQDGGFGLLALRSCPEGLLRDLVWSQEHTLASTINRLKEHDLSVALLEESFDVDRPGDLLQLAGLVRAQPERLHHNRAFLASAQNQAISVIVPVLNEAKRLPSLLASLSRDESLCQIVIVDGGSSDGTDRIASEHQNVTLVRSPAGRATQMNAGAKVAVGNTLLFLHADTRLPPHAGRAIRQALQSRQRLAGAFRVKTRYDSAARHRPWIKRFLALADLRSHYTRFPYGDQAIFVRASLFWQEGGFPDQPLFEDLALSKRLHEQASLEILPGPVQVSARRFQERPIYYLALMNTLPLLYRWGIPPRLLERWYRS